MSSKDFDTETHKEGDKIDDQCYINVWLIRVGHVGLGASSPEPQGNQSEIFGSLGPTRSHPRCLFSP
jgi:hypothetical protein